MAEPLIQEMQQLVGQWIEKNDWRTQELIDWLQGFGLPSARYEDEPFQWLLRGVPLAGERHHVEREFALRAATLLREQPDTRPVGRRPNELLYNLLELCAGLGVPDYLADPLYEMFERRALEQVWRGIDLRISLRRALIANQKDNRLENVWQDMLSGRGHQWLLGDPYDGFEGVRLQPHSADARGDPDLDAIGRALAAMALHIADNIDRRAEFRSLVTRLMATYPGRPSWPADLIEQADKNKLPTWAVSALPSLFVRLSSESNSSNSDVRYLVWNVFIPILKRLNGHFSVERTLCDSGIVLDVRISRDAEKELSSASTLIEESRISNPYKSYKVVVQSSYESMIKENGAVEAESISPEEDEKSISALSKEEMALYRESVLRDEPKVLSVAVGVGGSPSYRITDRPDK
jgi:hypothetical protein